MPEATRIGDIRFAPARLELRSKGLLGWICCSLNGELQLDGIALRKTVGGKYRLSFPARVDSNGVSHDYVKPLSSGVRDMIEAQVIAYVRAGGWLA